MQMIAFQSLIIRFKEDSISQNSKTITLISQQPNVGLNKFSKLINKNQFKRPILLIDNCQDLLPLVLTVQLHLKLTSSF